MNICPRWTEVDGGRRQAVHLMDGFRRRTIKNMKMWTEVDGWTDGRKSVRGGLIWWEGQGASFIDKKPEHILKNGLDFSSRNDAEWIFKVLVWQ